MTDTAAALHALDLARLPFIGERVHEGELLEDVLREFGFQPIPYTPPTEEDYEEYPDHD